MPGLIWSMNWAPMAFTSMAGALPKQGDGR